MGNGGISKVPFCEPTAAGFEAVEQFEAGFAPVTGARHCVAVNSGYTALFLALKALDIKEGDEVIVPTFTMIATAHAVRACGAKPVFVDCGWDGNIDPGLIPLAVTKRTKAIIPVHIYGKCADMRFVNKVARRHKLKVIEDAAEAHGAMYHGKRAGSLADIACFSFYGNKIISTGEGGAITTNDEVVAARCRQMRSYGFAPGGNYAHTGEGWSFRMNPYGAEIGIHRISIVEDVIRRKREIAQFYRENIIGVAHPRDPEGYRNVFWMYGIRTEKSKEMREFLEKHRVETRGFFKPMHLQSIFGEYTGPAMPVSEELWRTGVLLPSMPTLTEEQLTYITGLVNRFVEKHGLSAPASAL